MKKLEKFFFDPKAEAEFKKLQLQIQKKIKKRLNFLDRLPLTAVVHRIVRKNGYCYIRVGQQLRLVVVVDINNDCIEICGIVVKRDDKEVRKKMKKYYNS